LNDPPSPLHIDVGCTKRCDILGGASCNFQEGIHDLILGYNTLNLYTKPSADSSMQ